MQQRYYDPTIGRFLSTDPVGPINLDVATINRYSYAKNYPHRYVDPDGRIAFVPALIWGYGAFKLAFTVSDVVDTAQTFADPASTTVDKAISAGALVAGRFHLYLPVVF